MTFCTSALPPKYVDKGCNYDPDSGLVSTPAGANLPLDIFLSAVQTLEPTAGLDLITKKYSSRFWLLRTPGFGYHVVDKEKVVAGVITGLACISAVAAWSLVVNTR